MSNPSVVDRLRRGSEAIEFALTVPVLLLLVSGIVDFGWYFWQQRELIDAVRQGARVGSVTPRDQDAAARAVAAAQQTLADAGVPFTADVTASLVVDGLGEQAIRVHGQADYVGLWRLVLTPYALDASATMRREEQPLPPG